jgi:hypothetical protein
MKTRQEIERVLPGFYGNDNYYRYNGGLMLTDGVKYLADSAECYWLLDILWSYQRDPRVRNDEALQGIQFWTLKVDLEKRTAVVTLERDSDDVVLTQKIPYTDCPLPEIKLYLSNKVILLPSEY